MSYKDELEGGPVDQPVPYDIKAEEAVLGSLLIDRDAIIFVADMLRPEDFYREHHGMVYAAILSLYDRREPPDVVTLAAELTKRGQLERVGGHSALVGFVNNTATHTHIEYYGRIVADRAADRRLIDVGGRIAALGYSEGSAEAHAAEAHRLLLLATERGAGTEFYNMDHVMTEILERYEAVKHLSGKLSGVPTGFTLLDDATGGLQKGDLITFATRPSVGKTSFLLKVAHHCTMQPKPDGSRTFRVGLFSLEMPRLQLGYRFASMESGVELAALRGGRVLNTDDEGRFYMSAQQLRERGVLIDDRAGLSITSIQRKATRMKALHDIDLILIDYAQLVKGVTKGDMRQQLTEVTRGLKTLAKDINVPVFQAAQLSRNFETRGGKVKEPELYDLKESGSLEEDSDLVLLGWRPEDYMDAKDVTIYNKGKVAVKLAKHRNGPLTSFDMRFVSETTSFEEWDGGRRY